MIRSALSFNGRLILAMVVILAAVTAINPSVGRAHDTSGVPYHTGPTFHSSLRYNGSTCAYNLNSPTVVLGFTWEYVYWRPYAAYKVNGTWKYSWGDWKRAETTATEMIFGWTTESGLFSNGVSTVYVPRATNIWFGFRIFYGSNRYEHDEWIAGNITC